jgi:hypothetical protein
MSTETQRLETDASGVIFSLPRHFSLQISLFSSPQRSSKKACDDRVQLKLN